MASIIPATDVIRRSPRPRHADTPRAASTTGVDKDTIAGNFQTFLTLLTTQLKNQNPLDPLDTNQFTAAARAVRPGRAAAQVERPARHAGLAAEDRAVHRRRSSSSARPSRRRRDRALSQRHGHLESHRPQARDRARSPSQSATGQTVYTGTYTLNAGTPALHLGRQGHQRPAMARRQLHDRRSPRRTPTASRWRSRPRSKATVNSVDLTQSPPVLSIAGQNYTLDKIKRVVRAHSNCIAR